MENNDAPERDPLPVEFLDHAILYRPCSLRGSVLDLLTVASVMVRGLRELDLQSPQAMKARAILAMLYMTFERAGLPRPRQGWEAAFVFIADNWPIRPKG